MGLYLYQSLGTLPANSFNYSNNYRPQPQTDTKLRTRMHTPIPLSTNCSHPYVQTAHYMDSVASMKLVLHVVTESMNVKVCQTCWTYTMNITQLHIETFRANMHKYNWHQQSCFHLLLNLATLLKVDLRM